MVGFTGLVPGEMTSPKGPVRYGLSLNTMVDAEFRGAGVFMDLFDELKRLADEIALEFLLGFPNRNAFLPAIQLAGFRLIDEARFVVGNIEEAGYLDSLRKETQKTFLSERMLKWRLSQFPYRVERGCVIKKYQGQENLLDILNPEPDQRFHGVFPHWKSLGPCPLPTYDDYVVRLTCFPLKKSFCFDGLKRSLLFSDVY